MKIIPKNNITTISASRENNTYPSTNMINNSLKKYWKADVKSVASISIGVPPNADIISIFGVYGIQRITGSVITPVNYQFYDGVTGYDGVSLYQSSIQDPNIDWDFTQKTKEFQSINVTDGYELVLTLVDSFYPQIGIIYSGNIIHFISQNPSPGMAHELVDYSIVKEFASGSFYVKNRNIAESFSGNVVLSKDNWVIFKKEIIDTIGPSPAVWFIMDIDDDYEFLIFGRLSSMPSGSFINKKLVSVNLNIIEAL